MSEIMGSMGPAVAHSRSRNLTIARVRCDTNDTSNPDGVVDPGGVLDKTTVPAYSATGILTFTLRERWKYVDAYAYIIDTTAGSTVRQYAKVEGTAAANSFSVIQEQAHVAGATTDKEVVVVFFLSR